MTAPDYSKCWNCGKKMRDEGDGLYFFCANKKCKHYRASLTPELVASIHDRIAAVRDVERERCALLADVFSSHCGDDFDQLAARIRKGE